MVSYGVVDFSLTGSIKEKIQWHKATKSIDKWTWKYLRSRVAIYCQVNPVKQKYLENYKPNSVTRN